LEIVFEAFLATFFAGLPPRFFAPRFVVFLAAFRRDGDFFLDVAFLTVLSPGISLE
jgi:hypothetical protein